MNNSLIQPLFALPRSKICGNPMSEQIKSSYSKEDLPKLMAVAKKHDIVHLIAAALKANTLIEDESDDLSKHILTAVYRYEQQNYELEIICRALEKVEIPFMPLKG